MTELELLEKFEPVLCFAKSERFFPMAVESYLEKCSIFPSGPLGVTESLVHFNEPMIKRIGELKNEQHYLRFVNKPLNDSDAWLWWGVLSAAGIAGGWSVMGLPGVEMIVALSIISALILFMLASPIRLRIIPAALAALFFISLEIAPVWFFLHPRDFISITTEYLILLPIYLIALFYLSVRTMKFILDHVIPEGPGMVMDVLSQATETIAREAYFQYAKILETSPEPLYYGRVLSVMDEQKNEWTILQYHFFYAFNDWRLAANGMNHHEGDWEMAAVYLKNNLPYAVLLSQHGAGNIEKWETAIKAVGGDGNPTTHPVIYVALGSHANYSRPEVIRSPSMYKPGRLQRFLFWTDGLIHYLFLLLNPDQKARTIAMKEIKIKRTKLLAEDSLVYMRDQTDRYIVSLPLEIASGDGFCIGVRGNDKANKLHSSNYLKRVMSNRQTTRPKVMEWKRVLLNSEPDWVQYKGLWGVKSLLKDESGPPGPKWEKLEKGQVGVKERVRWSCPLDWLAELEKIKHQQGENNVHSTNS